MSSFLSAAENAARQRQNVRCDFKKMGEERTRAPLNWHWRVILFLFLVRNTILNLNSPKGRSDLKIINRFFIGSCCIIFFKTQVARVKTNRWKPF